MKKTNDILVYFTMSLVLLIKSFAFIFLFKNTISTYIFTLTNIYIYISFILLVTSFYFLMKSKHRTWYLFSIDVIITIILFADLVFYNGFSSFLSLFHLKELASVSEAKSGIGSLINLKYFTLFIDIIVLIPIMIAISKRNSPVKRSPILFVILIFVALNCFTDKNRLSKLQHLRYMQSDTMITQSPIGYHVYDIYSFIKSKNRTVSKKEIQTVSDWIKVNKEELPNNEYSGLFKGKNLLTVQFESLEQFVINEKADGQEITPNLNKLLKNSLYFNNYHQIINEGSSSDAEFATNTSLYP
ncbi:LTA synthase family protein [Aneurinibacillus tyrosinisolvens]|uniref:LTA synthase family protein n=1 Tax=Aneurinibacillus tyrosinisolvens TaxID=1443435 RepID=UPI00069B8AED|nr:hypothetical protein [Aneurinibacillus tyrosinisolvens]